MSVGETDLISPIADMSGKLSDHIAIDDNNQPYLIGGQCNACDIRFFPARQFCPKCTSDNVERTQLPRIGQLYTFSTVRLSASREVPYHLGYIDLPGNVRLLSHLRGNEEDFNLDCKMQLDSVDGDWFFSKVEA
jgi:uncharacterized OB-fold protein